MLNRWKLCNFKSVARADLALAPLTLFAGANSSGKSTLLQSILLISQTLASRVASQTILLNGYLTKLGQFNDLKPAGSDEVNVQVGWDFSLMPGSSQERIGYVGSSVAFEKITGDVHFGLSPVKGDKASQLNPIILEANISCIATTQGKRKTQHSNIKVKRKANTPRDQVTELSRAVPFVLSSDFDITFDENAQDDLRGELSEATPVACYFQHFLPQWLVVRFNEKEETKKTIINALVEPSRAWQAARDLTISETIVPEEIVTLLREHFPKVIGPLVSRVAQKSGGSAIALGDLINQIRVMWPIPRLGQSGRRQELSPLIAEIAGRVLPPKKGFTTVQLPGGVLSGAVSQTATFMSNNIRYLGPLREEPRSLYPLQTTADPKDVGLHGEHTAAVFHNFQLAEVSYIPSKAFEQRGDISARVTTNLRQAVFDWLEYLDVATQVDTFDQGKFGHGLSVYLAGSKAPHDLTHVGVGVSQVLPIVVMCLLAPTDATLMIEQPELHLNPKVQTRLADFFLSMALLSKQCLIETHSEYLINRLRLRAVLAKGASLTSLMKLYFVEKVGGITNYRDVEINEYGAIVDWPSGFFDQAQREIEDILLAASNKVTATKVK